jgi:translocation and assembly module TamA
MGARGLICRVRLRFDSSFFRGWRCRPYAPGSVGILYRACAAVLVGAILASTTGVTRAADPQPYEVAIAKTGDGELDQAINDSSLLVSLREKTPVGPFALVGRAREDEERFLTVLYGLGFYKGQVDVLIGGRQLDDPDLPDYLEGLPTEPPTAVTASIRPGPLFKLGTVTIEGSLPRAAREKLNLPAGAPAVAADVLAARERLLNALRDRGYALATVDDPIAILDLSADALDIVLFVDTGPLVEIGQIGFQGLERVNESFLRKRLLIHPGERYDPRAIEKARQNLASIGVFSSVVVAAGKEPDAQEQLPVDFVFTERKRHAVSFNAAYATDLGPSVSAQWQDRNLFGNAEQLKLSMGFSAGGTAQTDPGYWGGVQFVKPDFLRPEQTLQVDMSPLKESLDAYDRTALTGSVSINRKFSERWTGSIGIGGERERVTQQDVTNSYTLSSLPIVAKYDSTTDLFNPTGGVRATLSATPTRSLDEQGVSFVSLQASASTYLDAGAWFGAQAGRTVLALRGLVGDVEGASQFELPADKRFYAGGSATVRGYKYQSVGPTFPDGKPQGGTAVAAGTLELRQRILSDYGAVAFVDAGQVAANDWSFPGTWGVGAGVGGRYYTGIGPIRFDVAVPVNKLPNSGSFQIYIGIGQAF